MLAPHFGLGFRVAVDSVAALKRVDAKNVTNPTDPKQNKIAIDAVCTALVPDYLLILGATDVVPHQDLRNPMFGSDDPDEFAFGDLPYACAAVCPGAAFIAWDDAEQVAIAQHEVYQPSLSTERGVKFSRSVLSAPSSFLAKENVTDYHRKAVLAGCFDEELVGDIVELDEPGRLAEQLKRTIETLFCASDARKLADIMQPFQTLCATALTSLAILCSGALVLGNGFTPPW